VSFGCELFVSSHRLAIFPSTAKNISATRSGDPASQIRTILGGFMKNSWWLWMVMVLGAPNILAAQVSADQHPAAVVRNDDAQQLRLDLDRLKVLLNQMRTNLAFVQTSQSPLKHQFELEADAWQVIVEQMDRRLKAMEEHERGKAGESK